VEHQPDIAAALEVLRRQVFESGDYYPRSINPEYAAFVGITPMESNPPTIDELLEMQAEEGTHSILDIDGGVSDDPIVGTASPLSSQQLMDTFGTLTPTCQQVTTSLDDGRWFPAARERGSALYVTCYLSDQPRHIHFAGFSGD
jgi:hypothetical protein